MIRKTAQFAVLLLTVLFSVSCGIFRGSGKIVLTEKDSGRILETEVGDTLELRLSANPSTGYSWSCALPDMGVLRMTGERYENLPDTPPDFTGAPAVKIYTFAVAGPGEAGIKLEYRRPWERGAAPAKTFDILVRATGTATLVDRLDPSGETPRVGSRGQIEPRIR